MFRNSLLTATFVCLGTLSFAAADEKKSLPGQLGNLDKAKLFEQMDADGDGKVSKDEFKKFREKAAELLKNLPNAKGGTVAGRLDGVFDKMFAKMDADGDGKVTQAEFEKFQPAGGLDPERL